MSWWKRVDGYQRKHRWAGFPLGVVYKFGDDQGNYLAALITYYAFLSIFPLLLLASSILGFILQNNPQLQQEILDSTLARFPVIGDELRAPEGLKGSTTAVVVGVLVALYGALGVAQATQNALNIAWAVPRNRRPNPIMARLRSVGPARRRRARDPADDVHRQHRRRHRRAGRQPRDEPVLAAHARHDPAQRRHLHVCCSGSPPAHRHSPLKDVAGGLVRRRRLAAAAVHRVRRTSARSSRTRAPTAGVFALVLGMMAWIYLGALAVVLGIEINVVLARKLFPRALLTPFTDNVDLTEADRAVYTGYAQAQGHKGFQSVDVTFDESIRESRRAEKAAKKLKEEADQDREGVS